MQTLEVELKPPKTALPFLITSLKVNAIITGLVFHQTFLDAFTYVQTEIQIEIDVFVFLHFS